MCDHDFDDDCCCRKCGYDGAEAAHYRQQANILRGWEMVEADNE